MEIGTGFKFQEKHNFEIILNGNGAHRISEKGALENLQRWKWDMSAFQKRSISTSVGVEIGLTCFQKNRISKTAGMDGDGACPDFDKNIWANRF